MTNYTDQRKAFIELMELMKEKNFNENRAVLKLTLKYEVSERAIRKRIELVRSVSQ